MRRSTPLLTAALVLKVLLLSAFLSIIIIFRFKGYLLSYCPVLVRKSCFNSKRQPGMLLSYLDLDNGGRGRGWLTFELSIHVQVPSTPDVVPAPSIVAFAFSIAKYIHNFPCFSSSCHLENLAIPSPLPPFILPGSPPSPHCNTTFKVLICVCLSPDS